MSARPPILVLGRNGQVGYELHRTLLPLGDVTALGREEADLTQPHLIVELIDQLRPALVVNATAYTAVDRAESEPEVARQINAMAPAVLAEAAHRAGARMIHFSTDYVFDGLGTRAYVESDPTHPLGVYGATKFEGESAVLAADPRHLVLRLAWVYGGRGRNFLLTMLRLAREGRAVRVVADQTGSPSWSRAIAEATTLAAAQLLQTPEEPGGLYHLPSSGATTWHGFASEIFRMAFGEDFASPEPISTAEYPTPARRPAFSVLDGSRFESRFGASLGPWQVQLGLVLEALVAEGAAGRPGSLWAILSGGAETIRESGKANRGDEREENDEDHAS